MEILQQIAAMAAVLALLGGTLWWLRQRGYAVSTVSRRGATRRLECVERIALAPRQSLHLVRLGDRALLVACSPAGCALPDRGGWREIAVTEEARQ